MMKGYIITIRTILLAGLLSVWLSPNGTVSAQGRGEAGLTFIVGSPQGEFSSQVKATGFGLSGFGGVRVGRNSPLLVGLDLGILIYGHERRNEPFSLTIPDVTVDVVTDNNIFLGHILFRLQPPRGKVRPYFDGLFGMKYLFTSTRIENEGFADSESIAISTNFDDVALSYGVGGGLSIALFRGVGSGRGTVSLDMGVRYLIGGEAEYLQEGSIQRINGSVRYEIFQSETNLVETRVGVSVRF